MLTEQDCRALLARQDDGDVPFRPALLARASRRQMFVRMLVNLKRLYVQNRSFAHARVVTDALLALAPSSLQELRDRGLLSYHLHDYAPALRDLEAYLKLVALTDTGRRDARRDHAGVGPREVAPAPPGLVQLTGAGALRVPAFRRQRTHRAVRHIARRHASA